jgi:hypothetical protein
MKRFAVPGSRFRVPGSGFWFLVLVLAAACGPPPRPALPSGAGAPFDGFSSAYEQAIQECRDVQVITAEMRLSGRAGTTKLRGTITAGLAAPADIVLDGHAPFGKSVFILMGRTGKATLLLPRDNRVLTGEPPSAIVEALAGVALDPVELRSALAGCGLPAIVPTSGRAYGTDSAAVDGDAVTVYLRRIEGRWRVDGATRGDLTVQYGDFKSGRAETVFVKTPVADLVLRLSQVEINVPMDPRVFDLEIPKDAVPLTLEELRRAGPLGDRDSLIPEARLWDRSASRVTPGARRPSPP